MMIATAIAAKICTSGTVAEAATTQAAGEFAGVDAHRAGGGTETAAGAGVEPLVGEIVGDGAGSLAGGGAAGQLAPADDALAGRQGEAVGGAEGLAEAAFDAAVHDVLRRRQGLEVPEMGGRVVVEDDTGVEAVFPVEEALDAAHQFGGFLAPFQFDEGRHVAAGTVLGLERAVVLLHDQAADVVHEAGVAFHLGGVAEILGEDEMQVALQGVAENDRLVVAVVAQQGLQVEGGGGQGFDGEGHVLDDHRGAGAAQGADGGEGALPHLPVHVAGGGVGGELRRLDGGDAVQGAQGGRHARLQGGGVVGPHLDEKGGGFLAQGADHRWQPGLVLDGMQRRPVEQLDGGHRLRFQADHRLAGGRDGGEEDQGAGLVGLLDDGAVGDAGNEAQGALRADHQVGQDVDGVIKIHQGVEAVAGGVLDLELLPDAGGESRVGPGFGAQAFQLAEEHGVALLEGVDAQGVFRIQHRPVGQDHPQAGQGAVAVLGSAAAHAGSVVGGDTADLAGVDGGGVGADLAAERSEAPIHLTADDPGAEAHGGGIGGDVAGGETLADEDQHAVGDGLAGKAGAGGTEGDGTVVVFGGLEDGLHLLLVLDDGDDLGDEAVEAGVGAVGEAAQVVGDELVGGEVGAEGVGEVAHGVGFFRRFGLLMCCIPCRLRVGFG